MFEQVWTWAGTTRTWQTNIGIEPYRIATETENLCQNVVAQIGDRTNLADPAIGIVARFHHQLVAIHCVPNGNGRHARLAADVLAAALGIPPLSGVNGPVSTRHWSVTTTSPPYATPTAHQTTKRSLHSSRETSASTTRATIATGTTAPSPVQPASGRDAPHGVADGDDGGDRTSAPPSHGALWCRRG